ncbi:hypothetical protein [Leptospira stimsonii]|uniref:Outer membrane protein beta-barrel domain-containing protein n=1 Tax=Leptospira stimsonii TaxID=2202203 RepID=A0ABY2N057_9LEPT|nr:hypothetical protein [Leptospira stimsonii]TGK23231.1 hypothetical protein EHO98_05570 [Leptospira stimsonii]TGM12961.1 hypothetical protein EHQ90_14490 [Leptospira stimsonii]
MKNFFIASRIRILAWILFLILIVLPKLIFGNSVVLKDGSTLKNVKTTLKEDHVLVEDEFGHVEKIDLQLVEKILVSEIKKGEIQDPKKFKKFYFSLVGSQWNSRVSESMDLNRHYTLTDLVTTAIYIDPYLEKKYSVKVQSFAIQGEYRRSPNLAFSLSLEHNNFLFPKTGVSPLTAIATNISLNQTPEYQTLAFLSTMNQSFNTNSSKYEGNRSSGSAFTISTISLLPSVKYMIPISDSIVWFTQAGFGIGKSYESGIYSRQLIYGAGMVGTGFQLEFDSYFFSLTAQFRKTILNGSVHSYQFGEPLILFGIGFKI